MKCERCEKNKPEEQFHRGFAHCIECGKTGTLKPPMRPSVPFGQSYFEGKLCKAKDMVMETRQSVVLYHDERGHLSMRTVNDIDTIHVSRNMLVGYKYRNGKVVGVEI
jgi:hypothetical protein